MHPVSHAEVTSGRGTRRDVAGRTDPRGRRPAGLARSRDHGPHRPARHRISAEMLGVRADRRRRRSSNAPRAKDSSAALTRTSGGSSWRLPILSSSNRTDADGRASADAAEWAPRDGVGGGRLAEADPQRPGCAAGRVASPRLGPRHATRSARRCRPLALSFTDLELAERLSRAALVATEHPEALFALGMALTGQARGAEAEERARALCADRSAGDPGRRDGSRRHAFWPLRQPAAAIASVESAAASAADSTAAAGLRAMRALFEVLVGDPASGLRIVTTIGAETDAFGTILLGLGPDGGVRAAGSG